MDGQMCIYDLMETDGNPISPFISDGKINIGVDMWKWLKEKYTEAEITDWLVEAIIGGQIDLPLREITYADMMASFKELIGYKCNPYFHGKIFSRYEYSYPMLDEYISETNVGNMASDYFHQASRFKADSLNAPSPVRTWANEKFLRGALKALFSLSCDQVNDASLRMCLSLRKYVASQFKPAVAKSVYEKFNSKYVLDFASGWGDRLCGFYATEGTRCYVGIDPNTALIDGYNGQVDAYSSVVSGKAVQMICSPAEDVIIEKNSVDTVFTSPPYYNVERYSQEDTQSFKRYRGIDNWLNGFLFRAIDMAYGALQKGGHMIINISDVYSGHQINKICDPMNDHIAGLGGEYVGCIGMKMSKRPNSKSDIDTSMVFTEPMWVWRKGVD